MPSQLAVCVQVMGKGQMVQAVTASETFSREQKEGRSSFKTGKEVAHEVWVTRSLGRHTLRRRKREPGWVALGAEWGEVLSCKALGIGAKPFAEIKEGLKNLLGK